MNKSIIKRISLFLPLTLVFFILSILGRGIALGYFFKDIHIKIPFFSFDYVLNTGGAFNILSNQIFLLIILAIIAIFAIFYHITDKKKKINFTEVFALSLLCAGIISNTYERIKYGAVTDYIRIDFINFPIFNIADVFICIGAFILILMILKKG